MNTLSEPLPAAHRRFEALDSLRGVCAILVVMFHMPVASHWRDWGFIQHSYLFVDYFFVLSGFVIAHAYATRLKSGRDAGRFMVRLRLPNGVIQANQLELLAEFVDLCGEHGSADITTRQNLQLRGLLLEDMPRLLMEIAAVGLTSRLRRRRHQNRRHRRS